VLIFRKREKHPITTNYNKFTTMLKPQYTKIVRVFHEGTKLIWKAKIEMLETQLDRFVMLDDETPQEMYNHMKCLVIKVRAYVSKRWTNRLMVKRLLGAYTIRDTTLVSIIRGDPNLRRMTPDDVLARIM
jgi:hypothetical protein